MMFRRVAKSRIFVRQERICKNHKLNMAINFYSEDVAVPPFRRREVSQWITAVAKSHGRGIGEISYQFCNNDRMLEMNKTYLGHEYHTDIITFDQDLGDNALYADILISVDQVAINAQEYNVSFEDELLRVMIHGVLHLCGLDDHTESDLKAMRSGEDAALAQRPTPIWRKK